MARATPTVVSGFAVADVTSGNSITFNKSDLPAMADGDYLVAVIRGSTSSTSTDLSCTGFTRIGNAFATVVAGGRLIGCYGKVVTTASSEPSTYAFAYTGTAGRMTGMLLVIRGVDLTTPVSGYGPVNNSPTYYSTASVNFSTTPGSLILACAANETVSPNASAPTVDPDYTDVGNHPSTTGTAATRACVWVGKATGSGTTAPDPSGTVWAASSSLAYWGVSLQGPDVATEFAVKIGTGAAATATVLVGSTRTSVIDIKQIKPGFANLTAMLAKAGVTSGHRGASGTPNYPEMCERSYDYLIQRGYGILEFSANRTSDGVWVGCHDADLNRTSQTTGLPNISAQTWSTVQTFTNSLNSGGSPQPYYRLIDFLDKFTQHQVCMCDPKFSLGNQTEFLNILDAHGGPSKIIVKYAGGTSGGAALSDAAIARGYQTWGYFYQAGFDDGSLATYGSRYTILGMEIAGDTNAWNAINAYGKPVMAHIATTQAEYNAVIAKGADMVQCSRPDLIAPVSSWT